MKLANFFYLMAREDVFRLFRSVFDARISDTAVAELTELCLESICGGVIITEWFLFEELRPVRRNNKQLPAKTFYLMSSDDKKTYFIRNSGRRRSASHIGFAAMSAPENIRLAVKL